MKMRLTTPSMIPALLFVETEQTLVLPTYAPSANSLFTDSPVVANASFDRDSDSYRVHLTGFFPAATPKA